MLNRHSVQISAMLILVLLVVAVAAVLYSVSQSTTRAASHADISLPINSERRSASELYYAQQAEQYKKQNSPAPGRSRELSASDYYYAQKSQEFLQQQQSNAKLLSSERLSASERYYLQKAERYNRVAGGQRIDDLPK